MSTDKQEDSQEGIKGNCVLVMLLLGDQQYNSSMNLALE